MKNKRNTYILLSAVLILWGLIGYRVFASMNPSNGNKNKIVKIEKFQPIKRKNRETYMIHKNYRDPFLGTIEIQKNKTRKFSKQIKEKIVFPNIEYKGIFSSNNKKNTVFLITINGDQEIFKAKEEHKGIKLLKGDKEKIILKYKSAKQIFYLKK